MTGDNKVASKESRTIDVEMTDKEWEQLLIAVDQDRMPSFIKMFQASHPTALANDVISLGLMRMIKERKILKFGELLYATQENDGYDLGILTAINKDSENVLTSSLARSSCIPIITAYIAAAIEEARNPQSTFCMKTELAHKFAELIVGWNADTHPQILVDELITPTYGEEGKEVLIEEMGEIVKCKSGQLWLDTWYR